MRNTLTRLASAAVVAAAGFVALSAPASAIPINVWGGICTSQTSQLSCCARLRDACYGGCQNQYCRDECSGKYNHCLVTRQTSPKHSPASRPSLSR